MSETDTTNVKRRKAGEGRPPPEIGRVTPELAFRVALARAGEDGIGLEVVATSVKVGRTVLGRFVDDIEENALMAVLEGADGRLGLVVFSSQALSAIIEKQTTGRVVPNASSDRPPTRTDAVMCTDFSDMLLSYLFEEVHEAGLSIAPCVSGYSSGIQLEDARAVQMALEDVAYRSFEAEVDLERGAKTGKLMILLPYDMPRNAQSGDAEEEGEGAVAEIALEAQASLLAVLHRSYMTVAQVSALTVGATIPIPSSAISSVKVEDVFGEDSATGRLGMKTGHRAVRLNMMESDEEDGADDGVGMTFAQPSPDAAALPDIGQLPPIELPPAEAEMDLPPLDIGGGDLPALDGLPDLPPLGDLPDLGDLDLPPLP